MWEQLLFIGTDMLESFRSIWPYLLITIPIAVAVQLTGAAQHINRVVGARPILAILGATLIGAFSPLCACGVVPLIAALLIGGVPLAPIMAFWIASPTMDVEIFLLSVGFIGWELAVWRLVVTLLLSLGAGFAAHWLTARGWLSVHALRRDYSTDTVGFGSVIGNGMARLRRAVNLFYRAAPIFLLANGARADTAQSAPAQELSSQGLQAPVKAQAGACCPPAATSASCAEDATCATINRKEESCADTSCSRPTESAPAQPFSQRLAAETGAAALMVAKFMAFAFILQALIKLYIPDAWIVAALGHENPWAVLTAALLGMPIYTSNLEALPMIGGLLEQGMNPAAALAFLISGPMLTLPSMAAVWGLATRRVFWLYVGFAFGGALVAGYVYGLLL